MRSSGVTVLLYDLFSDLQVAVVNGAPAVCGLGHVFTGVEKAAEFAVEACAGDDELHT